MYERFKAFTVMILKIHRCIQKIKTEEMAEINLKSSHVCCLYYLTKESSLTATELCEICCEDKSVISHSLKFLEENGYINCDCTAKKRYNSPLALTEKGKELGDYIVKKVDSVFYPAGEGLLDNEREIMYKCLAQISANLEMLCQKYEN